MLQLLNHGMSFIRLCFDKNETGLAAIISKLVPFYYVYCSEKNVIMPAAAIIERINFEGDLYS